MDPSRTSPSSEVEDDIIELTDIVEKGSIPSAPGGSGDEDTGLESLMADLLAESDDAPAREEEDFDLDALLKASGLDDDGSLNETGAAAPAAPSSAGAPGAAALDSADMSDMDALLRDLVAPEQPNSPAAKAESAPDADFGALLQASVEHGDKSQQAPAGAGSEVDADDLDSLLTSIMEPESADTPAQSSAAPASRQRAAVARPADTPAQSSAAPAVDAAADLGDLDDLLGDPQPDAPRPAAPPAAPAPEIPKQNSARAAAAKQPTPPPAVEAPAVKPAAGSTDELDLDALLGEAPVKTPASASVPETPSMEEDDDPLSGLDELLASADDGGPGGPAEEDLGDPLLVGKAEAAVPAQDGMAGRARTVSAHIAATQKNMADLAAGNGGADTASLSDLRDRVDELAAELRELAESYASGLAAAEARISALEAELASGGAPAAMSGDMAQLEQRLKAVETAGEKVAAEAAARVIREEIAALLTEMGPEL
ncbi:MAG: hypothetical protein J1E80_03340 [Desulfovibrionaceae bacterium]|nr:hypothetical protein [Desulfovibrionaceae bacterium]